MDFHEEIFERLDRARLGPVPLDQAGREHWRARFLALVRDVEREHGLEGETLAEQFVDGFLIMRWEHAVAMACHGRGDPVPEGMWRGCQSWYTGPRPPGLAP